MAQNADMQGSLQKLGGGVVPRMQERHFVLQGRFLYYFKSASATDAPLGCIDLEGTSVEEEPKGHGFAISGPALPKKYRLCARAAEERREWVEKLRSWVDRGDERRETVGEEPLKVCADDFEKVAVLGHGGFGVVTLVRAKGSDKVYAMKEMKKSHVVEQGMQTNSVSERVLLSALRHPFVVRLHHAFQNADSLFYVMDYLSGGDLYMHLREARKFSESRAKFYAAQITSALTHIHSRGILYRDLKPENCVLDSQGYCCLTDFGLAKQSEYSGTFCGTPEYIAPELLCGIEHNCAVDWWSLGCLVYEMVIGLPPFYDENISEMYRKIIDEKLSFEGEECSPEHQQLCRALLERKVVNRLQKGSEVQGHAWMRDIDFCKMLRRELPAPVVPDPKKVYFDAEDRRPSDGAPRVSFEAFGFTYNGSPCTAGSALNSESPPADSPPGDFPPAAVGPE